MGYEIKIIFHPRKEEGGYDTNSTGEQVLKVGAVFDDTPLEKVAGVVMSQLARRDVWVTNVEIDEFLRHRVTFKEAKDGKGILLKNKKFSVNSAAQMMSEDIAEVVPDQPPSQNLDDLYSNPNKLVPIKRNHAALEGSVNQQKTLYKVIFDPAGLLLQQSKREGLRFTFDKEYSVHQVVPGPEGRIDLQKIIVTDDTGKLIKVDERYFTVVGIGLMADKQLGFTSRPRGEKRPKLAFEDQMHGEPVEAVNQYPGIPVDDGSIMPDLLKMPDIRPNKKG